MTQIGGLFDLSGRVAIVTGATGVLGGAMARGLAAAGARVGVLGRCEELAKNVAVEIGDSGAEALALPADVLDASNSKAFGRLLWSGGAGWISW
jgi:NAD(P)-dependent dehydrogenase (short-subunit alcohol dehydrogenase family)